jgi:hypothetical protein
LNRTGKQTRFLSAKKNKQGLPPLKHQKGLCPETSFLGDNTMNKFFRTSFSCSGLSAVKAFVIAALLALAVFVSGCEVPVESIGKASQASFSVKALGDSIDPVTISGTVNTSITTATTYVNLTTTQFSSTLTTGTVVSDWFTNLPDGLVATILSIQSNVRIRLAVRGTPTVLSSFWINLTIPASATIGTNDITIAPVSNALYDIRWNHGGWSHSTLSPFPTAAVNAVAYGAGTYVVSSYNDGTAAYTVDGGSRWTRLSQSVTGFSDYIPYITFMPNGTFYAVGSGGILAMAAPADIGTKWTPLLSGHFNGDVIKGIAYSTPLNTTVIVASGGNLSRTTGLPGTGSTWTDSTIPGFTANINSVSAGTIDNVNYFVITGQDGFSAYSNDGISWTDTSSETQPIFGSSGGTAGIKMVTFGANKFVAVGYAKAAIFDGHYWTGIDLMELMGSAATRTAWLNCVTYGGGYFVAGGSLGQSISSEDGINWAFTGAQGQFDTTSDSFINNIAYNGDASYGAYMIGGSNNVGPGIAAVNSY